MFSRLTILLSILMVPLLWLAFFSPAKVPKDGLRMPPEITHAAYMGYTLSQDQLDALTANFASLEPTLRVMRERADAHVLCFIPGQSQPKPFAVFLYEGLIFDGYDADSWLIQGQGGRAKVYKMNTGTQTLLSIYSQEADDMARRISMGGAR